MEMVNGGITMRHNSRLYWQNEERKLRRQAAAARDRERKGMGATEAVQVKRSPRWAELVGRDVANPQDDSWWLITCPSGCHFGEVFKVWGPQANYDCSICQGSMKATKVNDGRT